MWSGKSASLMRVENGWLVRARDEGGSTIVYTCEDPTDGGFGFVDSLRRALLLMIEMLGADPGDHARRRLYLVVAPGEERPDFPPALADLLAGRWGGSDADDDLARDD